MELPVPITHRLVIITKQGPIEWGTFSSYISAKMYAKENKIHRYTIYSIV